MFEKLVLIAVVVLLLLTNAKPAGTVMLTSTIFVTSVLFTEKFRTLYVLALTVSGITLEVNVPAKTIFTDTNRKITIKEKIKLYLKPFNKAPKRYF